MAGGSGDGGECAEELREGQLLLGAPTFEDMDNGRVRCVETGHELLSRDMAESYGRSKGCRLALIDAAVARKKPPLNMFKPDPLSKSKLICKLTGDTINKSEEHIWKHITGKRFQNKLKQKEAAMDTETPDSNGVAGKKANREQKEAVMDTETPDSNGVAGKKANREQKEAAMDTETPVSNGVEGKKANRDKKKAGKVAADGDSKKTANHVDKPSRAKQAIAKNHVENINGNGSVSSKVMTGSSDSEEPDFWVPPIGSRWDFDDGKDRWEDCSNSSPEKDEDVCEDAQNEAGTGDLAARTKRMSIAVGPSSNASRKKKSKKGSAD